MEVVSAFFLDVINNQIMEDRVVFLNMYLFVGILVLLAAQPQGTDLQEASVPTVDSIPWLGVVNNRQNGSHSSFKLCVHFLQWRKDECKPVEFGRLGIMCGGEER